MTEKKKRPEPKNPNETSNVSQVQVRKAPQGGEVKSLGTIATANAVNAGDHGPEVGEQDNDLRYQGAEAIGIDNPEDQQNVSEGETDKETEVKSKRPAPVDPNESMKTPGGFGFDPKAEQVTTGSLYVDPKSQVHPEINQHNQLELAVTPGPEAYTQILKTAPPQSTEDLKLVKVKIEYPADYKGQKYLVEGKEYEVSPETAWQFINEYKIATEVKD